MAQAQRAREKNYGNVPENGYSSKLLGFYPKGVEIIIIKAPPEEL
jgi:hypothetical protein